MRLGRVIGTLVPSVVTAGLAGVPMLWVQPLDRRGGNRGRPIVCADPTRMAGPGETVYWEASREAALTLDPAFVPVDHAVVGIVDDVQIDDLEVDDVQIVDVRIDDVRIDDVSPGGRPAPGGARRGGGPS